MHNVESPNILRNKNSEAPQHSDWAEKDETRDRTGRCGRIRVYRQRQVAKETKKERLVR